MCLALNPYPLQMFNGQLTSMRQKTAEAIEIAVAKANSENDALIEKLEDALEARVLVARRLVPGAAPAQ